MHRPTRRAARLAGNVRSVQSVLSHGRSVGGRAGRSQVAVHLGVNSLHNFAMDKTRQFGACNYDGYVIGDVILFYPAENHLNLVGRAPVLNWIRLRARTGGYPMQRRREIPTRTAGARVTQPDEDHHCLHQDRRSCRVHSNAIGVRSRWSAAHLNGNSVIAGVRCHVVI